MRHPFLRVGLSSGIQVALIAVLVACVPAQLGSTGSPAQGVRVVGTPDGAVSASLSGQVLAPDGRPLADAVVRIYEVPEDPLKTVAPLKSVAPLKTVAPLTTVAPFRLASEEGVREVRSGQDGRFAFPGLPAGVWTVVAEQGEDLKALTRVETGASPAIAGTLRLAPPGTIRGIVSAPDQPLVNDFTRVDVFLPGLPFIVKPSVAGNFALTGVPAGSYVLRAYRDGLGEATRTEVTVRAGQVTELGSVALTRRVPRIVRLDPPYVPEGGVLRIVGENFGIQTGDPFQVFVDGKVVRGVRATDASTLEVPVTEDVQSGKVFVSVGSLESNALPFHKIIDLRLGIPVGALALSIGHFRRLPEALGIPDDDGVPVPLPSGPEWSVTGDVATLDASRSLLAVREGEGELRISWGSLSVRQPVQVYPPGTWVPSALVGSHMVMGDDDGSASEALLRGPSQIVFDARGRLIIGDEHPGEDSAAFDPEPGYNRLRILEGDILRPWDLHTPDGEIFEFLAPRGMALAPDGHVLVVDAARQQVFRVSPDGEVSVVAGSGQLGYQDGAAPDARFDSPWAIAVSADGRIAVSDLGNRRIRLIQGGQVSTLAGTGERGLEDGPRGTGTVHDPFGLAWAPDGTLWTSDRNGNCLRTIDASGHIRTVSRPVGLLDEAGLDALFASPTGEGPLNQVDFRMPYGLRFDREGALWVCDWQSTNIRRVKDGQVSTVPRVDRNFRGIVPFQGITGNYSIDFDPDGYPVVNNTWWHTIIRLQ